MQPFIQTILCAFTLWICGCSRPADLSQNHTPLSQANWIAAGPESADFDTTYAAPYFRKSFEVDLNLQKATAYVTAGGYFTSFLNGQKIGDRLLDPAVTRYDQSVKYVTFEVTDLVNEGPNVVGAVLANGFYNVDTKSAWNFDQAPWRNRPALLLEIVLDYGDYRTYVRSDSSWQVTTGPIMFNQLRNGEYYDARKKLGRWSAPDYSAEEWPSASVVSGPQGRLSPQRLPPIRRTKAIKPAKITEPRPGVYVVDFGQNIAGWTAMELSEPEGSEIIMRYGERIYPNGTLDTEELSRFIFSGETQTTRYISNGVKAQYYEPWTTYFGFQYVQIEGLSQKPSKEDLTAFMLHTAFDTLGYFKTSNALINQLHENIQWSYLGNYHSFPEDCPHREKMGWTGDAQLVVETGLFNYDARDAYAKWLADFRDEQPPSGALPGIIPTSGWGYGIKRMQQPYYGPHWEGAAIAIPWQVYRWTGDTLILQENYGLMKSYIDFLTGQTENHLLNGGIDDHKSIKTHTEGHYLSSAYYHWLTLILADIADVLGRPADAERFRDLASYTFDAFQEKYSDPSQGTYGNGGQTQLAVALGCKLVPKKLQKQVFGNLIKAIQKEDYHFDAGVVGVKKVVDVLMENGRPDVLYRMSVQTDFPSFGYWVEKGASTMWQNWDGSQSRNHIMFGSIGDFFYKGLAGINPVDSMPGFGQIHLNPYFPEAMDRLEANHKTPKGWLKTSWRRAADGLIHYLVTLPEGTETFLDINGIKTIDFAGEKKKVENRQFLILSPGTYNLKLKPM